MAHPRGLGRKRSHSLDRAHVSALHARYTTEDAVSSVHDDGVRHPLRIVRDKGTGGEALGVVRKVLVRVTSSARAPPEKRSRYRGSRPVSVLPPTATLKSIPTNGSPR